MLKAVMLKTSVIMKCVGLSLMVFVLSLVSVSTWGQGIVLLGDNEYAQRCYRAAENASLLRAASDDDIEQCTLALDIGALKPKDRLATLVNRGILYAAQENYAQAKADYERAMQSKNHGGEAYANLGNLYFLLRDYDTAVENYTKAIDRGMSRAHVAYLNRGMVFENTRRWSLAQSDYEQAMQLAPEWQKARELHQRVSLKLAKQAREASETTE